MKAISCELILTRASTRNDGSLGLSFQTPELSPEDKVAFMEMQNLNLKAILQPLNGEADHLHEVKAEFEEKTPSQRLRSVIFIWWKQQNEPGEFQMFYKKQMEKLIDFIKTKLAPE